MIRVKNTKQTNLAYCLEWIFFEMPKCHVRLSKSSTTKIGYAKFHNQNNFTFKNHSFCNPSVNFFILLVDKILNENISIFKLFTIIFIVGIHLLGFKSSMWN